MTQVAVSMEPTIKSNEVVQVNFTAYGIKSPRRWDVVAFEPPPMSGGIWLKRVIGLPGETVSFGTNGLTIDGQRIQPPQTLANIKYTEADETHSNISVTLPYLVPRSGYFVLGDNPKYSYDSRYWGAVSRTNIVGKVHGK